jgi:hypothetical protein
LSLVDSVDALAQRFERLVTKNDAVSAGPERVNQDAGISIGEEHHGARSQLQPSNLAKQAIPFLRPLIELQANERDIRLCLADKLDGMSGFDRAGNHYHVVAFRPQRTFDQLAIHLIRFRDQNVNDRSSRMERTLHRIPQ